MIDDIDYLIENSEKDSMIIYVDSGLRNKALYPHPNQYTITFAQPFRFVYGFEVVDGAIPNTMYNIDAFNNTVYLTTVAKSSSFLGTINTEQYFREVSTGSTYCDLFNNVDEESFIIIGSEDSLSGHVNNINVSDYHFIYYRNTIDNPAIYLRRYQSEDEFYFFKFNGVKYAAAYSSPGLVDILKKGEFYFDADSNTLIYFDVHKVSVISYNNAKTSGAYTVVVSNYRKQIPVGNYDILTISSDLSEITASLGVDIEPTSTPPKKEGKVFLSSTHYIVVNSAKGRLVESLGFDIFPHSDTTNTKYKPWVIGDNKFVFGGIPETSSRYKIVAPGLTNLLGERICILRIKELEDHLYGSFSYMDFTPGIGMFKMAAAQGSVTNLRWDFTSLVRKPFHPIGKLDKLSMKFEITNNRLYDFKGVNHQLMFIIKYLVPTRKLKFSRSILNPNYDGNVMEYMSKHRSMQYKEDSDDEEEFDEEEYYQMYKKQLDNMDYSESESDESSGGEYTSSSEEDA